MQDAAFALHLWIRINVSFLHCIPSCMRVYKNVQIMTRTSLVCEVTDMENAHLLRF